MGIGLCTVYLTYFKKSGKCTTLARSDFRELADSRNISQHPSLSLLLPLLPSQEDAGCFVHKQGFLVKQGGKVKNWKKRLFVLDSDGLSYYKTEQVMCSAQYPKCRGVLGSYKHGNHKFHGYN